MFRYIMTNHMRENERSNVYDLSKCLCNTCLEVYHLHLMLIATAPMVSQFLTGQQSKVGKHLYKLVPRCPFGLGWVVGGEGELILKNFQKLPMDTQGFPCVTLTKRYDLVWDSGGAV